MEISILILILILSVLSRVVARHPKHDRFRDNNHSEVDAYNNEDAPTVRGGYPDDASVRLKRFENKSEDLDPNDMESVKEALREILHDRNIEELFTLQSEDMMTHTHASRSHRPTDSDTNDKRRRKEPLIKRDDGETTPTTTTEPADPNNTNSDTEPPTTPPGTSTTTIPLCYTTTSTTTTTPKTTTQPIVRLDIPALMDIISNFTYDWLQNLTRSVNETLLKKGIPTCPQITSTTPTTISENMTGTLMGKCFSCGLDESGIPRNAHCADAFAGDFLPLVPVDPKARSQLARYRKYCRYKSNLSPIPRYRDLAGETRTLWGEWTGGCAVRWIDISGIYTQRVCRIKHRPVLGRHYGSKRMTKMELALQNVDNGCLISPMATLIPFSRGVSLYARFHVCVCTGNWCNRATANQSWTMYIVILPVYAIVKDFTTIIF